MCFALKFMVKAVVGVLAAFMMIACANITHGKLKTRMPSAGLTCLGLFFFALFRTSSAKTGLLGLFRASTRSVLTYWQLFDLSVITAGISTQIAYTWTSSSATATGDLVEEAATIFWLWVLFLLAALTMSAVTSRGRSTREPPANGDAVEKRKPNLVFSIEALWFNDETKVLAKKIGASKEVMTGIVPRADSQVYPLHQIDYDIGVYTRKLAATSVKTTLLRGDMGLLGLYANAIMQFVTGRIDADAFKKFQTKYGSTPGKAVLRMISDSLPEKTRFHAIYLIDDHKIETTQTLENAIWLMCIKSLIKEALDRRNVALRIRVLYHSMVDRSTARSLYGKTHEAQKLPQLPVSTESIVFAHLVCKDPPETRGTKSYGNPEHFRIVYEMFEEFELSSARSVLHALARQYNEKYIGGRRGAID
jgi:hypothetical protein